MIDELLEKLEGSLEKVDKKIPGVLEGTVLNPLDPQFDGRLQVRIPQLDDLVAFARVAVPMAGPFAGMYFIPNPGDQVLVAFENGDVRAPYIIGCLWNMLMRPPLPTPLTQIRGIRTLVGNQISFMEVPPTVTIQNGPTPPIMPAPPAPTGVPYSSVVLSPAGMQLMSPLSVTIMVGANMITVTPAGVTIASTGPAGVSITSTGPLSLSSASTVQITAGADCSITAGGMVRIQS